MWLEAGVPVWGTVPERVSIATVPRVGSSAEGLEVYGDVLRKARQRAPGRSVPDESGSCAGLRWSHGCQDLSNCSSSSPSCSCSSGRRLPELAKGMGQAAKEFRSGLHDDDDDEPAPKAVDDKT